MGRPWIVGLTGGMGAGKSTIVNYLNELGSPVSPGIGVAYIFDCDAAVHRLYKNPVMRAWLTEKFGTVGEDARAYFAQRVMEDPLIIDLLEAMFIPAIKLEINDMLAKALYQYMIVDAPLLFETGLNTMCDFVVVVHCPEEIRRERIMQRPGMTEQKMNMLLKRQLKDADRLALADFTINNTGSKEWAYRQTDDMLGWLRKEFARAK